MGLAERRLMQCGKKHVPASPWGNKGLRVQVSVVDGWLYKGNLWLLCSMGLFLPSCLGVAGSAAVELMTSPGKTIELSRPDIR
jgi:hypothetical protein